MRSARPTISRRENLAHDEAVKYETARAAALALPETTEEPHHHFGSFRVRGKIFVTVPLDRQHLHVFVDEEDRELALGRPSGFRR